MGKFKMPTAEEFLAKKKVYWRERQLIWEILEKEMRDNVAHKPYNEKVGEWLKFLRDLRYHFFCEDRRKLRNLKRAVGPAWYFELSSWQREILHKLKDDIHQDLAEDLPRRVRRSLSDLGITLKIPKPILMKTMMESVEDPGIFIWKLYTAVYNHSPSELQNEYDMNEIILMSALVFIDLDECVERLDKHAEIIMEPPKPKPKAKKNYYQPNVRYGEYLQKITVPCYFSSEPKKESYEPPEIKCRIKLRRAESYENLIKDQSFIEKRIERNRKDKQTERVCKYKFWEPPSSLRNTDPKMAAYVEKLKLFKLKARARHMKYKAPFDNIQVHIGTVCYAGDKPHFMLNGVVTLPTGYIPLHGGTVNVNGAYITHILGMWKYPRSIIDKCDSTCDCMTKWEGRIIDYLKDSKCQCGHLYDLGYEGKPTEKYFYPPNKHGPYWIDMAKVYQMDPTEDFILDTFKEALKSQDNTPEVSLPDISPLSLKNSELLQAFLAELSDTPLIIPHLPEANLLNNLQQWVGNRVKGKLKPKKHKILYSQAQRSWLNLKHVDFRARAYLIPFTLKQLQHLTWSHRDMIQTLLENQVNDFVTRNRIKQMEATRLWWPTMMYDTYPSKAFLDVFFSYMPGRMKDTFIINPYDASTNRKSSGKTCPLNR